MNGRFGPVQGFGAGFYRSTEMDAGGQGPDTLIGSLSLLLNN